MRKEQQRKEEENKKREQEDDKKYDQIINCPVCFGGGKAYTVSIMERCEDGDTGREHFNWVFNEDMVKYPDNDISGVLYGKIEAFIHKEGYSEQNNDRSSTFVGGIFLSSCPFCNGKGIAYSWLEASPTHSETCKICQGGGKITKQVKVNIGIEDKEIPCDSCRGTGNVLISEKEIIHVKTLAGGMNSEYNQEEYRDFPYYWEQFGINRYFLIKYKRNGVRLGDGKDSFKFYTKLTDNNRNFFFKEKIKMIINFIEAKEVNILWQNAKHVKEQERWNARNAKVGEKSK